MHRTSVAAIVAFLLALVTAPPPHHPENQPWTIKIVRFLRALSHDRLKELESLMKNLLSTKCEIVAKFKEFSADLQPEVKIGAYDFYSALPFIVGGPIHELRYVTNKPTPPLKTFIVQGLATLLNDELTLLENCELNFKGLHQLSAEERVVLRPTGIDFNKHHYFCPELKRALLNLNFTEQLATNDTYMPFGFAPWLPLIPTEEQLHAYELSFGTNQSTRA